jgi:alkylated DNA repair dioxygenase AlkB
MSKKIIYDPFLPFEFIDSEDYLRASYIPKIDIDDNILLDELGKINFTRVHYISRFGKANRTPRLTWCYGKINNNVNESVEYKGLNFEPEAMPQWLEKLSKECRNISIYRYGFDPKYNSCIIGKYENSDDQIGFHFDTETFLTHHFCANVTLGYARDFQFKDENKQLYEIKLQNASVLFFSGLEHSLPKRSSRDKDQVRYSISFRNMKNNIGIGNSYYYCRGLAGAIDDDDKLIYEQKLKELQL